MNGTSIALYSTSWHSDQREMFRDFFGDFGHVTKLANRGGLSGKPVEARRNSEEVATCPFPMNKWQRSFPFASAFGRLRRHAKMENTDFDGRTAIGLQISSFLFPTALEPARLLNQPAKPVYEVQVDQIGGEHALPLLRLSGWEANKQYDKNNPVCIHYDYRWKIS
jgi:hypothetical protein